MERKTRMRAPNFTCSDNLLLCNIMLKYKGIIESKKIDGTSVMQKQKAWRDVANEFNSINDGYNRTVESLQQNYKNLKKKAKKNAFPLKVDNSGGPLKLDEDILLEKVKILVEPAIDELTTYDEDTNIMASQSPTPIEPIESYKIDTADHQDEKEDVKPQENGTEDFTNDEANTKPTSNVLMSRKRKLDMHARMKQSVSKKFKILATEKLESVRLQKELLKLQLQDEQEKLEHHRMLRVMEIEDMKKRFEHCEIVRKIELDKLMNKIK